MLIENHPDFKSATEEATKPERKYEFERHELEKGESIPWHFHRKAEEIIIVDEGTFLLAVGEKREIFWLQKGDEVRVIHLLRGETHALLAISDVSYVVYKTQADKIVRCQGPNLQTELERMHQVVAKALIERRKMMKKKKGQFALYVGYEGLDDANTNEIIQGIIADGRSSVSMVFVVKEYKGEEILVLEVTRNIIERFYAKQHNFKLKFTVYSENNYILQQFRLLEPGIRRPKQLQLISRKRKKK